MGFRKQTGEIMMYDSHIFLDFEMNPVPREVRSSFPEEMRSVGAEIIEIGAVKLDLEYRLIDRFSCFVRPRYAPIAPHITELTGIRDQDVEHALYLEDALVQFSEWIGTGHIRLYSWSMTDLFQLEDECWLKDIDPPEQLLSRWMDFQRIYTHLMGISRRHPLSLKNALGSAACTFDGEAHRAVHDAENSAMLLAMVHRGEHLERTKVVRDLMKPTGMDQNSIGGENSAKLAELLAKMQQNE
ncbi:MAG: exonuclease domain-containing protein [Butyricicoccaceae bacterium]